MKLFDTLRTLRQSLDDYQPLVEVGVSRANLLHNLHTYQEAYPTLGIAPVLKSNAYGHGLLEVARILDGEDVPFFMTDSWYEARRLRRAGIRRRILIMGYARPELIVRGLSEVECAMIDIEQVRALSKIARHPLRIHLKIDTGMHRQGIASEELGEVARLVAGNHHLRVVGVGSHLGDADTPDSPHTRAQVTEWRRVVGEVDNLFRDIEYRHIGATPGMAYAGEAGGNVARVGAGIYGFDLTPGSALPLRPVLELRSSIVSLRHIQKGSWVGYNATHTAAHESVIATVPVGYFEGVDRRLSGTGIMLVNGNPAPIAGRVSMNMTSLDVSGIKDVARGDQVIAISRDPAAVNSVRAIARRIGTHPGEILVHIPSHLRRVID